MDSNKPSGGFKMKLTVEEIAAITHETNRAYCAIIGDHSQPFWADAPNWQRESAIEGVRTIALNPTQTPSANHVAWMAKKLADGWMYGEKKDPEKKLHPCIGPYELLPEEQRIKDSLFLAVVKALLWGSELPQIAAGKTVPTVMEHDSFGRPTNHDKCPNCVEFGTKEIH
jgi:hypothetical protein